MPPNTLVEAYNEQIDALANTRFYNTAEKTWAEGLIKQARSCIIQIEESQDQKRSTLGIENRLEAIIKKLSDPKERERF